jgi:hypothetical protein
MVLHLPSLLGKFEENATFLGMALTDGNRNRQTVPSGTLNNRQDNLSGNGTDWEAIKLHIILVSNVYAFNWMREVGVSALQMEWLSNRQ